MITVAEVSSFQRKIRSLLKPEEISELISFLAEHPESGVLIQGTGGIRKLRWAQSGKGKRGGIRVIYYFHAKDIPLYLLAAFGKNEKANLSAVEKQQLAKLIKKLVSTWRQGNG